MVRNVQTEQDRQVITAPANLSEPILGNLDHQIVQAMLLKPLTIHLDCSTVQTVDSASLNWLLAVQNRLVMQHIHFFIQEPTSYLRSVFIATRLDQRLKFAQATPPEALDHA